MNSKIYVFYFFKCDDQRDSLTELSKQSISWLKKKKIKGTSASAFKNELSWLENGQMGNGHIPLFR